MGNADGRNFVSKMVILNAWNVWWQIAPYYMQ